ncbi:MAG: glycosyltransferase family 87 protein [Roseiarcus sp.]
MRGAIPARALSAGGRGGWRAPSLGAEGVKLTATIVAALGASYVLLCLRSLADGGGLYGYSDFHALWVSGSLADRGAALTNYDPAALHAAQVAAGMSPHHDNPFPYPPTLLMGLAPLGALSLPVAFWVFMVASAAAYLAAMTLGRLGDWRWWAAALVAPASGVVIAAGQTGFLTGALALGGLRLVAKRPIVAGVLFGLLGFKPQLGVLIPVALVAAGAWRTIFSAALTFALGVAATSLAFGGEVWPAWVREMLHYARSFDVVLGLMPTVYAEARLAGAPDAPALLLQAVAALAVAVAVWRAARGGLDERAVALVLVGTFLATPHAFNYDMPMMTAAIAAFVIARSEARRPLEVVEAAVVVVAFMLPFLLLHFRAAAALAAAPALACLFATLAAPGAWRAEREAQS